jgi:predicted nuclease with TOPRIM domain
MGLAVNGTTFKSPDYKLLAFFHRSRDTWKAKAQRRNLRIKRLKNEVAAVRESRRKWKEKVQTYEARIAELEKGLEEQKNGFR